MNDKKSGKEALDARVIGVGFRWPGWEQFQVIGSARRSGLPGNTRPRRGQFLVTRWVPSKTTELYSYPGTGLHVQKGVQNASLENRLERSIQ